MQLLLSCPPPPSLTRRGSLPERAPHRKRSSEGLVQQRRPGMRTTAAACTYVPDEREGRRSTRGACV